jgi:hypothetical protein
MVGVSCPHRLGRSLFVKIRDGIANFIAKQFAPDPFRPTSDHADMKALLAQLIGSEAELEIYIRSARIVVLGDRG